jgi:hypothetical protein
MTRRAVHFFPMKRYLALILFGFLAGGIAAASAAAPAPFAVGPTWSYATRKGEPDSRLVILRIYNDPKGPKVVFVAVRGLSIRFPPDERSHPWDHCYMPFPETILRQSVIKLESEQTDATFGEFEKIYRDWKKKADAGKIQSWTSPVAKSIESLEAMIRHGRK